MERLASPADQTDKDRCLPDWIYNLCDIHVYIYVWYTIMQQIYEKHFLYARTKLLK